MTLSNPFGVHFFPNKRLEGLQADYFQYASSIDDIPNLYAHYAFLPASEPLPIVILMHGYTQDANSLTSWIMEDMASYGFFVCAVGMRGRNGAGGDIDVSGRELYDIIDAVEYIKQQFPTYVNTSQVHVSGYSGGGGNVFGLASKFPDYFNTLISHFGISDYGYDPVNSWWETNGTRRTSLEDWIGFNPINNSGAYYSRAHQYGVGKNFSNGHLFMFHDNGDNNVPPIQSTMVEDQLSVNSRSNYTLEITTSDSDPRWLHASPHENEPVRLTRDIWGPPIINKEFDAWSVDNQGSVLVQGYIRTKRFEIWLGNGQEHVAEVAYDVQAGQYTITPLTGTVDVSIKQGVKIASQTISIETVLTVA